MCCLCCRILQMAPVLLVTTRDAAKKAAKQVTSAGGAKRPSVAGVSEISAAAEVLKDSKELLQKLKKMLAESKAVSRECWEAAWSWKC